MRRWFVAFVLTTLLVEGGESDWPSYRGPYGNGIAIGDAPLHWSDTENVKWKVQIPGLGHSSPIIWGNRVFVTTAIPIGALPEEKPVKKSQGPGGGGGAGPLVDHQFEVICVDLETGKVLWQRTAKVAKPHEGYSRNYGSFASNSPVTDGKHLFAFFGSRGMYCYDLDGKLIWEKDLGVKMRMRNGVGEGTAAVLDGDALFLKFDQESNSFVVALDRNTGKEKWRMARDEVSSWSPPYVVEYGRRKQVVVSATNRVRSYDYRTGTLVWEAAGLGTNVIPAPVHQNGVVYVMSGDRERNLLAIRLDREGDLTGSDAILWTNRRGNPYNSSPVLHDNKLYLLTDSGMLSCLNATTGEAYYQQVRLPKLDNFKSSLVGANGKLYLASENGDVFVVKMGEKFEALAVNTLKDQIFIATPAIAGGQIILRSQSTLYCIQEER